MEATHRLEAARSFLHPQSSTAPTDAVVAKSPFPKEDRTPNLQGQDAPRAAPRRSSASLTDRKSYTHHRQNVVGAHIISSNHLDLTDIVTLDWMGRLHRMGRRSKQQSSRQRKICSQTYNARGPWHDNVVSSYMTGIVSSLKPAKGRWTLFGESS